MTSVLAEIAQRVRVSAERDARLMVAIDGVGASGKTTFCDRLAERLLLRGPVIVVHADDFFAPPVVRHARGRHSPEGFWHDAYDYASLTAHALDPLAHGLADYQPSIAAVRARTSALAAPLDAIVLVEGTFLHREEIRHRWDFSIYLHTPLKEATSRMAARGTVSGQHDPRIGRYTGAQRLYFAADRPWDRASVIVDNSDFAMPVIVPPPLPEL